MPDLTSELLPPLETHRLPDLDLVDGFQYPHYGGWSILNLPATICGWMSVPEIGAEPLAPEALSLLGGEAQRVIMILVDALSRRQLGNWIANQSVPLWASLAQDGYLLPLTSITPSTTSAALTSLWTGRSAAEHGIVGYELWLKEYGVVANMIQHSPMNFRDDAGGLKRAGFTPENFMPLPTLGPHLTAHGVKTYAFLHRNITRSGLSQMFLKDVDVQTVNTPTDLAVNLYQLLESHKNERFFTWVYWDEVDRFSHFYGPDDERTAQEFFTFSAALERLFLERLSPSARQGTLLVLTADHGQVATHPDPHYDLRNHTNLTRRLHILPTGENRLMYLFIQPGQSEAVREYVERTWPRQFTFIDPSHAIHAGLFGPGEPNSRLGERVGDLLVVARGNAYLWWGAKEDHLYGRHGGLSPDEMLVPLLVVRF